MKLPVWRVPTRWRAEAFLCGVYIVLFGYLLVATGGLPYVMDNNESFSAFWHARNLYDFGWAKSFGLADESFAYHAAAHPYVHTHQGNFPRVFAYLIYVLGARTIESQIAVTTFTIGALSMLFAHRYFRLLTNGPLAWLAVALLMTDYILVMQWHVVTYRVWHMFFVFSTLLCAHGIGGDRRRLWLALTVVNYVCLFYYEFIFVAFVALFAGLYTGWLYRGRLRTLILGWICQVGGALIGLSILTGQLILYLGWDGFLHDAYLTFVARNHFQSPELLDALKEFYESHNIAFWYNLEDGARFQRLGYFAASVLYYELQIHTPYFFMLTLVLAGAYVLGHADAGTTASGRPENGGTPDTAVAIFSLPVMTSLTLAATFIVRWQLRDSIDSWLAVVVMIAMLLALVYSLAWRGVWPRLTARTAARYPAVNWYALTPNFVGILILILMLPSLLDHVPLSQLALRRSTIVLTSMVVCYAFLLVHMAAAFEWTLPAQGASPRRLASARSMTALFLLVAMAALWIVCMDDDLYLGLPPNFAINAMALAALPGLYLLSLNLLERIDRGGALILFPSRTVMEAAGRFSLFVFLASAFVFTAWRVFYQKYAIMWRTIADESWLPALALKLLLMAAIVLGGLIAAFGRERILGSDDGRAQRNIIAFLIIALLAYGFVYYLSPGYIFSGYRFRFAPFTVFHTQLLVAIAVYVLVRPLIHWWPAVRAGFDRWSAAERWGPADRLALARSMVIAAVLLGVTIYWGRMQVTYARLFPPDHFSVFKRLGEPPYAGATFAVGNYAAPVAAYTRQWAYYDPILVVGATLQDSATERLMIDHTYLWFADRKTNKDYNRPDYFICLVTQSFPSVLSFLGHKEGAPTEYGGCSSQEVVKMAIAGSKDLYPRLELVAIDEEGERRVGFDAWAIVRLHWRETPRGNR